MTAGEALRRWRSPLGRELCRMPGRCSCCGAHLATQPHGQHCLLGPRAFITVDTTGRLEHNPTPAPLAKPDTRYGPPGTTTPAGKLPTTCRSCGGYPANNGAGHNNKCPSATRKPHPPSGTSQNGSTS